MSMTAEMMDMLAKEMAGMDMMTMQECMEACAACEQACTMCAGSMMGEDMAMCNAMCMTMADMANATMRMMMRPAGMHRPSMMLMLEACMTMAKTCAEECMRHGEMNESCAMCAKVCMHCAMACEKMLTMMRAMA